MSRLGFKTVVYHGDVRLGELDTVPVKRDDGFQFPNNEIRIHRISANSERCHPLSVLQTIASSSVRCKLEPTSNPTFDQSLLVNLHASCFYELKTVVVIVGNEELHLVAMPSKLKKFPCFWCYSVPVGLYDSCLTMLNLRCLAIVFDLDETLIVANTMKSFEDRIEALRNWIAREVDPIRASGMSAEMNRYIEDRALLKQYVDNDCVVVDGGKVYKAKQEEVRQLSDGHEQVVRPVIRLQEKNIVLTRINPEIRDTSVLVKLRPAWEDLKNYLTAKGRKRFEVYVCTMAERDYALEMWRLLDPEAHLINSKQQLDRIVCVKSDGRKSLLTVFQEGSCHPKMAMVIDDRLKVWEDRDQPRVHVVPAFTPYYAPQAEMANAVPVLCVARNVACNVRGGFFKEFDENLLQKIPEVHYEDEVVGLPSAPDVSHYLMPEDASFVPNGNANAPFPDGISGPEAAQRLNYMGEKSFPNSFSRSINNNPVLKENSQLPIEAAPNVSGPTSSKAVPFFEKPSLFGASLRRDSSFSDTDTDVKRKLPNMSRGQDSRSRVSAEPVPTPKLFGQHHPNPPSQGGWLMEEDPGTGRLNGRLSGAVQDSDAQKLEKQRPRQYSNSPSTSSSNAGISNIGAAQVRNEEVHSRHDGLRPNGSTPNQFTGFGSQNQSSANINEPQPDGSKLTFLPSVSISVLQEIGRRCNSKVEFRPLVSTSEDLRFSFEVLFTGEKIGFGMGKTRKDAQQQAAENALHALADKYKAHNANRPNAVDREFNRPSASNENGFIWDVSALGSNGQQPVENGLPKQSTYKVGIPDNDILN